MDIYKQPNTRYRLKEADIAQPPENDPNNEDKHTSDLSTNQKVIEKINELEDENSKIIKKITMQERDAQKKTDALEKEKVEMRVKIKKLEDENHKLTNRVSNLANSIKYLQGAIQKLTNEMRNKVNKR